MITAPVIRQPPDGGRFGVVAVFFVAWWLLVALFSLQPVMIPETAVKRLYLQKARLLQIHQKRTAPENLDRWQYTPIFITP